MDQYWLTIIIVIILIVGIVFDGVRRMRKARNDSLQMKLKPTKKIYDDEGDKEEKQVKGFGSEFPNGGARVSTRTIDPDRIKEVRNKYNFGADMSAWRERVVEKIAEHTGKLNSQDDDQQTEARIEPSFEVDPLFNEDSSGSEYDLERSVKCGENTTEDDLDDQFDEEYDETVDNSLDDSSGDVLRYSSEDTLEDTENSDDEIFDYDLYDKEDDSSAQTLKSTRDSVLSNDDRDEPFAAEDYDAEPEDELALGHEEEQEEPVQVSLNLDDSVPMLMDTFESKEAHKNSVKKLAKKPLNPFAKPTQEKVSKKKARAKKEPVISARGGDKPKKPSMPEEVLVIHVHASKDHVFYGNDLLDLILDHGLRFGAMDIFHRHAGEDGEGPILFSLSNMVKPGIFDLHTFEEFSTVGVSLFLALPVEAESYIEVFDAMLATAKGIANNLQGELKDENRSVLTGQTIEHYRERIRDFSRRQQLEKHKL